MCAGFKHRNKYLFRKKDRPIDHQAEKGANIREYMEGIVLYCNIALPEFFSTAIVPGLTGLRSERMVKYSIPCLTGRCGKCYV